MLAVMENQRPPSPGPSCKSDNSGATTPEAAPTNSQEFLATGRTGRRNALPDILATQTVSYADLPNRFQSLSTSENATQTEPAKAKSEPVVGKKSS